MRQVPLGRFVLGEQQHAASLFIQSMHHADARVGLTRMRQAGQSSHLFENAVGFRAAGDRRQARWFQDRDEVVGLPQDFKGDGSFHGARVADWGNQDQKAGWVATGGIFPEMAQMQPGLLSISVPSAASCLGLRGSLRPKDGRPGGKLWQFLLGWRRRNQSLLHDVTHSVNAPSAGVCGEFPVKLRRRAHQAGRVDDGCSHLPRLCRARSTHCPSGRASQTTATPDRVIESGRQTPGGAVLAWFAQARSQAARTQER